MASFGPTHGHATRLRCIELTFDPHNFYQSASNLAYSIHPEWCEKTGEIDVVQLMGGITNTLLKVTKRVPGRSQTDNDRDSVLIRAYGNGSDNFIDRDRDVATHIVCAEYGFAPPLLARCKNGVLYRYIIGQTCTPQDLITEPVWRAVAKHLGEWHARLPTNMAAEAKCADPQSNKSRSDLSSKSPVLDIWAVMQRWTNALPCASPAQKTQKQLLQIELDRSFRHLVKASQCGSESDRLVLGHCDLGSANIILLPKDPAHDEVRVSFIDYEYAVPCPAAFDIANHFAEWAGYDCDYSALPTKSVRRRFLQYYLESFKAHCGEAPSPGLMLDALFEEVDRYRGMPGLYGGLWALLQAAVSQINFDYTTLAEGRLGEYYAWRAEEDGSRARGGKDMPFRERRWAECQFFSQA
ncbi:kinase-like domain-containing protein [Lasiosphaeris hirsuta]|uniref:ethanolamine kinase n=1 Tax=Lasiosphaeris hirsuta TaxID=260670 RepID=A0AA39ZS28_9PEZI|nr:kinase-like domain-containing protein [Lasiosphaeris hirsuta]